MIEKGVISLSDKIIISDPCYNIDTWCKIILTNVLAGNYKCFYDMYENRIANIYIFHEKYKTKPTYLVKGDVGVDSGQAGFYDYNFFKENKEDEDKSKVFYEDICNLTYVNYKNPNYVPFEKSQYYTRLEENDEEFINYLCEGTELEKIIDKYIENLKVSKSIEMNDKLKEFLDKKEIKESKEIELIKAHLVSLANIKYLNDYYDSQLFLSKFDANTYKEKAFVSSTGYGDGIYNCYVGYNSKNQIVSVRVRFL